ncbi:MAG: GntP family permease, partial [Flavobacteriaceae bacterium]
MLHPYIIVALALALIILLSFKLKLHPFLSLFVGALFTGILSGQAIESVIAQLISGFGTTLGQIGWIIAFGTLLGVLLEKTKAT